MFNVDALDSFLGKLVDAGVVPKDCCRVVIDVRVDEMVKVYYDCFGDKQMLSLELASLLSEPGVIKSRTSDA